MRIKFEPTGTHIRNGKLKVRLDFYPDPSYKTYALQNIDVFVRELTEEEKESKGLQELVPKKKQLNPFLCHFITIDPDMTKGELISYIKITFNKDTLTELDNILCVNNRESELRSILQNKSGNGKIDIKEDEVNMRDIESRFIGLEEVI